MVRRFSWLFAVVLALSVITATSAIAMTKVTRTIDGVKATLMVSPKMVDLHLVDLETGDTITKAKAQATIVYPDGSKVTKNLMGMKMGEGYSFMNSVDLSQKGSYTFKINIETGEKTISFEVEKEVK